MESECNNKSNEYPKVAVLMSAYNGKEYIIEQVDSILTQSYPNIQIYIRDDGSTDGTATILEGYEKVGKIKLVRGENVGYIKSFFQIMKQCERADYYAWCDQDDIWETDKIERAVKILEKTERSIGQDSKKHKPLLYFSDYDYYDEEMNYQEHGLDHKRGPSFANSLMDCIALGFNSVFNHEARRIMEENIPEHCCGHDWWTYMVCSAFGHVIYDRGYKSVKYRRMENSVSPGGKNFIELQIWRFKKFFINDYFAEIREQLYEFSDLYGGQLHEKDKKVMALFIRKKYSLLHSLKKTLYPVYFRQGILEELMVRILFLLGKL